MLKAFLRFMFYRFLWLLYDQKGQLPGEVGAISHRWDLFVDAPTLVQQRFTDMENFAINGYTQAMAAIQALTAIGQQLQLINTQIAIDTEIINEPTITETPPTIDTSQFRVDFPAQPIEPTLIDATLGPISTAFPEMVGPGDINPGDLSYVSNLLTALQKKILNDVKNGSTGIPDYIQDEMFKKNYERDLLVKNDELDAAAANWGKGGFPFPNGGLRARFDRIEAEFTAKRTDVSRDIMFKSWEYALQNTHFMIQQGVAVEALTIRYAESVATRVFEASKAVIDSQIRSYESRVKGFSEKARLVIEECKAKIEYNIGRIRMYEASVNAFSSKMHAEAERINAVARGYEAETQVFTAIADFDIKKVDLDLKIIQARIDQAVANANIKIKDKEVELKAYELLNSLKEAIAAAIGQIAAQIAAGALSAVHAQVHIGSTDAASYSAGSALSSSE